MVAIFIVPDPLIDGRRCSELIQDVNPDLTVENVECADPPHVSDTVFLDCSGPKSNDVHTCNFCNQIFVGLEELNQHTAMEHQEFLGTVDHDHGSHQSPVNEGSGRVQIPLLCAVCHEQFDKISLLTRHVTESHNFGQMESGNMFRCQYCPANLPAVSFRNADDLGLHLRKHHAEEDQSVKCPDCNKKFKNYKTLKGHVGVHWTQKMFQCGGCGRAFGCESNLRFHVRAYCGNNKLPPIKSRRKERTVRSQSVAVSVITRIPAPAPAAAPALAKDQRRKFTCKECGLVFYSRDLIQLHVAECEAVKSRIILNQAEGLLSRSRRTEENKMRDPSKDILTVKSTPVVSCEETLKTDEGDKFEEPYEVTDPESYTEIKESLDKFSSDKSMESLNKKNQDKHGDEKNNDNQTSKQEVQVTTRFKGKKNRVHQCPECPKSYQTTAHLREHMISHTGVFPHNCVDCGQGFRRRSVLAKHSLQCPGSREPDDEKCSDKDEETFLNEMEAEELSRDDGDPRFRRGGSETTRSGRVIKPKRFFEDLNPAVKKRKRRRRLLDSGELKREGRSVRAGGVARVSTQCGHCGEDQGGHLQLFRHAMSHLDPDIIKTFPVYEEGDTGEL